MFELTLMCPQDRVESMSEALDALEALSVSVEDADAQTDAACPSLLRVHAACVLSHEAADQVTLSGFGAACVLVSYLYDLRL